MKTLQWSNRLVERCLLRKLRLEVSANDHHFFLPALLARLLGCWVAAGVGVVFSRTACWASSRACFSSCSFFTAAIWRLLNASQASRNFLQRCHKAAWRQDREAKREKLQNDVSPEGKRADNRSLSLSFTLIAKTDTVYSFTFRHHTVLSLSRLTCMFSYISSWCLISSFLSSSCCFWCSSTLSRSSR